MTVGTTRPGSAPEAFYAALARGDGAEALRLLGNEVRWHEAPGMPYEAADGRPYVGADAVAEQVLARIAGDVEELSLDDLRFTRLGSTVVVEGAYHGTARRSRRLVNQPFVHVWTFGEAETPAEFRQYTDTALFRATLDVGRPTTPGE